VQVGCKLLADPQRHLTTSDEQIDGAVVLPRKLRQHPLSQTAEE